jgi:hypothetical protein
MCPTLSNGGNEAIAIHFSIPQMLQLGLGHLDLPQKVLPVDGVLANSKNPCLIRQKMGYNVGDAPG